MNSTSLPPISFQIDIPKFNEGFLRTSSGAVSATTGKNINNAKLFRSFYTHPNKTFRIPVNITVPTAINVETWIKQDDADEEVVKNTRQFIIGPSSDHEYAITPYGNLRKLSNMQLFQQLNTLILTKQQLDDVKIDFPLHLQHLDLSFNRFKHVPSCISNMKYLRVLKMPGNSLQEVRAVRSLPLTSLLELHFQDNDQLTLIDLSGMHQLQFLNCLHAHDSLQLINCAHESSNRELIADSSCKRVFIDEEDEQATTASTSNHAKTSSSSGAASLSVSNNTQIEVPGWSLLSSTDWIPQLNKFRNEEPFLVQANLLNSRFQIESFFSFYEKAFLLENVVPNETKVALMNLQQCCAFQFFFPAFDALVSTSIKKNKLMQFAAFVRFCETHQCFLNWNEILQPTSLFSLFASSKYTLDLLSIFPSPNEMNRELVDCIHNQNLFDTLMLDRFSNQEAIERWKIRCQQDENTVSLVKERIHLMIHEIKELAKASLLEQKHMDELVAYEIQNSTILHSTQSK